MPHLCTTPNCPCSQNPLANLTSEQPDKEVFIGLFWSFIDPFLGRNWTTVQCGETCQSSISQADADACARRLADRCVLCSDPNPPCPPLPPCPEPCVDPPLPPCPMPFCNVPQGCQNSQYSSQVSAGEFYAHTQADADAIAASACQTRLMTGPRTPNAPGCPIIISMSPVSPINTFLGDNVVISAVISYTGSDPLTYLWYVDGLPLVNTPTASLALNAVTPADSGTYVLQVSVAGCPDTLSPGVILDVASSCVEDFGPPPPIGATPFEITSEVEWETFSVVPSDYSTFVSSDVLCNPTFEEQVAWANQPDHPPGVYQLQYLSGFFEEIAPTCGFPICSFVQVLRMWDDEHNFDAPIVCADDRWLANGWAFCNCSGQSFTGASRVVIQNQYLALLFNERYGLTPFGGSPANATHSNTGGDFRIIADGNLVLSNYTCQPGYELTFKVWQISGLIQQPRKLVVDNWNVIKSDLPASVANVWGGHLNVRTSYVGSALQWDAPALGTFGGAKCYYTQAHPTSPNGCGWVLEIYSAPLVLEWRGFKVTNDTGNGNYLLDPSIPSNLACINLLDNS